MKLYRYRYNQAYSCHAGLEQSREDLGVLGSEVKTFIPDAVTESVSQTKWQFIKRPNQASTGGNITHSVSYISSKHK